MRHTAPAAEYSGQCPRRPPPRPPGGCSSPRSPWRRWGSPWSPPGSSTRPTSTPRSPDLADTLGPWTYALVAGLAFLETGAFVGLIAPGETALVLGGVVAAKGGVDLPVILALTWAAAALGDLASFLLGRRLGRRFLERHGPRIGVNDARLARIDVFFARHGAKAILVGRFIGIVRAVAPFTAGASGLRLRGFCPGASSGPRSGRRR